MQLRQIKAKLNSILFFMTFMCFFLVWSCGDNSSSKNSGTGALSFNVVYHDGANVNLQSEAAKIDCAGQGIADVVANVFDSDSKHLVSGGPWSCDDKQGRIVDVPVGRDRIVVVLGRDADGNVLLGGQESGIAVNADSENNAVTIDCYDFLLAPADEAVVKQGAVVLQWQEVAGAAEYRVFVSQNIDMSDPVIVDSSDTANYTPSGLISMTTYYWQVIADDMEGKEWIDSQIRSLAVAGRLPDTGQTDGYTDIYGEDSDYTINPPTYTKLDASGNVLPDSAVDWAMVRDDITGLTWEVKTDHDDIHYIDDTYTWQSAQDNFIAQLNSNTFGGYSDWHWRLPTIKELYTLADKGRYNAAVNREYFPFIKYATENPRLVYWSSTTYFDNPDHAWFLDFQEGDIFFSTSSSEDGEYPVGDKRHENYVLAVRGRKINSTLVDNKDGTVTDIATGLMWQQDGATDQDGTATSMTWENALTYCEELELAGHKDWRLPNINELQSIVDYLSSNPAVDVAFFPDTQSESYWSSTTFDPNSVFAWDIDFVNGDIWTGSPIKTGNRYVRAVRGGQ